MPLEKIEDFGVHAKMFVLNLLCKQNPCFSFGALLSPFSPITLISNSYFRYYPLEISYFKSSLDRRLFESLWHKYWVNTLSASTLLAVSFSPFHFGVVTLLTLLTWPKSFCCSRSHSRMPTLPHGKSATSRRRPAKPSNLFDVFTLDSHT